MSKFVSKEYIFTAKLFFKHNKSGGVYEVLSTSIIDTTNDRDNTIMILYKKVDDPKLFIRAASEFYQKFTAIVE